MIREEWIHILIKRGFSASGAKKTVADLREAKPELEDEDFGLWLKNLDTGEIPKILANYLFGQKKQV